MENFDILDEFRSAGALLEGHFILSSGLHSPIFLQKMFIFQEPKRTERVCKALAKKAKDTFGQIDVVISPAIGGIIPGYETARHLEAFAFFVERENGVFQLRRGFQIPPKARILVVEDILTTGLSLRETLDALAPLVKEQNATIIGAACLIDRSNGPVNLPVPYISLGRLEAPTYEPKDWPTHLAHIPATKPGSRLIKEHTP